MQAFMTEHKVNESMVTDKLEQTYVVQRMPGSIGEHEGAMQVRDTVQSSVAYQAANQRSLFSQSQKRESIQNYKVEEPLKIAPANSIASAKPRASHLLVAEKKEQNKDESILLDGAASPFFSGAPPQEVKGSPLQLISISEDLKTFKLNYEALEVIREIEGDIGIVAVSGSQRTGKSFILNLLLNRFNKG